MFDNFLRDRRLMLLGTHHYQSRHERTFWTVPLHTKLAALAVLCVVFAYGLLALFAIGCVIYGLLFG